MRWWSSRPCSSTTIISKIVEKIPRENPRLRSNESPSGAFKWQSGLRKQMEGLCHDKLRRFSRGIIF